MDDDAREKLVGCCQAMNYIGLLLELGVSGAQLEQALGAIPARDRESVGRVLNASHEGRA